MDCRRLETREVAGFLEQDGTAWIVAEQDAGGDEFLVCLLHSCGDVGKSIYRLDLQFFKGINDDLNALQDIIIGGNINAFCERLDAEDAYLLLDDVYVVGTAEEKRNVASGVQAIVSIFKDFCKGLRIIVRSPVVFSISGVKPVVLQALDEPECQSYIELHPLSSNASKHDLASGAIYAYTSGLPGRIDNLLNELRFSSFDAIALGTSDESIDEKATIPVSLRNEIERLKNGSDYERSTYDLLVALTFFRYGESISTIKCFKGAQRIRPGMPVYLVDAGLAELAEISELSLARAEHDKFVKIKPSVQKYIHRCLGEAKLIDGFEEAATTYFGNGWKIGRPLKIHSSFGFSVNRINSIVEQNAALILARLISDALALGEDDHLKSKYVVDRIKVFHDYLLRLIDVGKYLYVVRLCQALLPKLNEYDDHHFVKNIRLQFARSLRMLGEYDDAIGECKCLLEQDNPAEVKGSLYVNMAYAYENLEDVENARQMADFVLRLKRVGSSRYHAESILIGLSDGDHKYKRLDDLAEKARRKGAVNTSNTIRMDIIAELGDPRTQLEEYRKLADLAAKDGDSFNMMRARVYWFELATELKIEIDPKRIDDLVDAYTYSCSQRQRKMFMQSHAALWELLEKAGQVEGLFKLFRHSSILQRLTGKVATELMYLKRLYRYIVAQGFEQVVRNLQIPILRYFVARAASHNLLTTEQLSLVHRGG